MRCRICACVAWAVRVCVWAHVVGGCGWQRPSCKHPLLSHYHPTAVSALLVYIQCCARKHHPYMLPSPGIYFRSISYTVNNKIAFRHRSLGHSRGGGAADPRRGEPQIACCRMASAPPSFPSAHAAGPGYFAWTGNTYCHPWSSHTFVSDVTSVPGCADQCNAQSIQS
jgi:hypothetical protein